MLPDCPHKRMIEEATGLVHADRKDAAAAVFAKFCKMPHPAPKPQIWNELLTSLYHWMLNNGALEEAAQFLWTPQMFNPNPRCTRDVWKLFDDSNTGLIMGAASMSKSYTMGARLLLEWTRDPHYTTVQLIGPSEGHLQRNLFSHLVRLHSNASIKLPGEVGDLFIGLNRRDQGSAIFGVVIPLGQNKKAGRIQGSKCFPRPTPHPVFGSQSRMFIFLDEIENVPEGIWSDIDNVLSNTSESVKQGMKIFGAYNPLNPAAEVAKRAEPPFGWKDLNPDEHYRWKSTRDWDVLRLDAMRCENVIEGKTVYPGLQTRAGVRKIAKNSGGTQSPGYLAQVRAMYPTTGTILSVFAPTIVQKLRGEFIWESDPTPIGGADLALEGNASAIFAKGSFGAATGIIRPPSLQYPAGAREMFRNASGIIVPRYALQLDALLPLAKGDTVAMYESVVKMARTLGIKPEHLCVDRTGNGAGVHDLLRNSWSMAVMGVNYSSGATERKIMAEDLQTPKEEYSRIVSELWFAMRKWSEFGYLLVHPSVDVAKLFPQLTERMYKLGKENRVESKEDYISRGKPSPDEADALSLLVHAVRISHSIVLSMTGDPDYLPDPDDDVPSARIDPTSMFESLDD